MPLQAETAIDAWREWRGSLCQRPEILGTLDGGRSNLTFLLGSGKERLVLRLNGPVTALPGQERRFENGIWQSASDAGVAPPLVHADPHGGYLVSVYITNRLPAHPGKDPALAAEALQLLQRCHQLSPDAAVIDYARHIGHYWQLVERRQAHDPWLDEQREPMQNLLDHLCTSGLATGLCHHDPVVENFVGETGRLYLIDWEYAARGLLLMDYAALGIEWQMDDEVICRETGIESDMLNKAKSLYRYMCALWEAAGVSTQANHGQGQL